MPPKPRKPTGPLRTIPLLAPPATALNPRYRFCAMDVITNYYHRCYHWPITVIQEWSSQLLSHATSGYVATVLGTEESIFWHCTILQLHPLLPESPPPPQNIMWVCDHCDMVLLSNHCLWRKHLLSFFLTGTSAALEAINRVDSAFRISSGRGATSTLLVAHVFSSLYRYNYTCIIIIR